MNRIKYGAAAFGVMGMAIFSPVASAAEIIDIGLNGSFRFEAGAPITNIAIANPEIADIARPSGFDDQVIIVGLKAGSTTLYVWLADGSVEEYMVVVSMDDIGQSLAIQRAIGLPNVIVQVVDDENKRRVLLKGTVKNQKEHEHAMKIASLYAGGKIPVPSAASGGSVSTSGITSDSDFEYGFDYMAAKAYDGVIDLLTIEVPSQIRLEAQIIEISADDAADLGFKYYRPTGMTEDTSTGFISVEYANNPGEFAFGENIHGSDHRGSWLWRHFSNINAMLQFLITNNKAHVLSRPSVSTMSGAKAKIFIGGQLPVPVSNGNGDATIQWKDYGIRLNIRPTVEDDGTITAEVHAGVSRLDYAHTVTTSSVSLPSISTREAHSIVHMTEGSTMVIGGLLNSEDMKSVTKIPLLSSIPVIGEFFKFTTTSTDKRELMILITPVLVDENTPARMSEKMEKYYQRGQEEEKARNDVDLNAGKKEKEAAEAAKREEKERAAAREAWDKLGKTTPRVKPADPWRYAKTDQTAEEAASAPEEAQGNEAPSGGEPEAQPVQEKSGGTSPYKREDSLAADPQPERASEGRDADGWYTSENVEYGRGKG